MNDLQGTHPPASLACAENQVDETKEPASARPPHRVAIDALAFALSALFSPYLVLPFGTLFVIGARLPSKRQTLLWTAASVFFTTIVPAVYVVVQLRLGRLTDVHIMEREQRGGPFLVAIFSAALGTMALYRIGAPAAVWGIGLVIALNGIVLTLLTARFKISMHVAVLSSTVLAAYLIVPGLNPWKLAWMIPALMWARVTRGRHTVWQGVAGCTVSSLLTFAVIQLLPQS